MDLEVAFEGGCGDDSAQVVGKGIPVVRGRKGEGANMRRVEIV